MITIYYRNSCLSSRKAINWLNDHHIPYRKCSIDCVSSEVYETLHRRFVPKNSSSPTDAF